MSMSGRIAAATKILAINKLDAIRSATLTAQGFAASKAIRRDMDDANISAPDGSSFIELTFNEQYRRRAANVLNCNYTISDSDGLKEGMLNRTYSGSVIATGATDSAAYAAAVAKARELGDNKHTWRLSARITRSDRNLNSSGAEHLRVEYEFSYQIKGQRIYMEAHSGNKSATFGDNMEDVSGFIIGPDEATCRQTYLDQVRSLYASQLIRDESVTSSKENVSDGTYNDGDWSANGAFAEMHMRLEFSLGIWTPKPAGFAIKYRVEVEFDYVSIRKLTSVQGQFWADPTTLSDSANGVGGNPLDIFLAGFGFGILVRAGRSEEHESVGTTDYLQSLTFSRNFVDRLTPTAQVLACSVSETIVYSGIRWVFQPVPDGPSIPQNCGIKEGSRKVSGEVTAATEAAAMTWVKKTHLGLWATFPTGIGGGAAPADRYYEPPEITRNWEFLELTDGTPRGGGANVQVSKASFNFSETLPEFEYAE